MNLKINSAIRFFALILVAIIILSSCGGNNMRPEKALKKLSREIENGNLVDISLTIYYHNIYSFSMIPWDVDAVINNSKYKIEVDGARLEEQVELLKQICNVTLTPIKQNTLMDARIYYVFKDKNGNKIFDVAMWGCDESIYENESSYENKNSDCVYINGVDFVWDNIFGELMLSFLPEDAAEEMEEHMATFWPN